MHNRNFESVTKLAHILISHYTIRFWVLENMAKNDSSLIQNSHVLIYSSPKLDIKKNF